MSYAARPPSRPWVMPKRRGVSRLHTGVGGSFRGLAARRGGGASAPAAPRSRRHRCVDNVRLATALRCYATRQTSFRSIRHNRVGDQPAPNDLSPWARPGIKVTRSPTPGTSDANSPVDCAPGEPAGHIQEPVSPPPNRSSRKLSICRRMPTHGDPPPLHQAWIYLPKLRCKRKSQRRKTKTRAAATQAPSFLS